jgi:nucleoid DNA-binding protein
MPGKMKWQKAIFATFARMNLEQAIGELLFHHDCVIIPGFGGFVTNYRPAQVHPTQHTFTAPSKSIVFNRSLKNNDGLLANHLVQVNHLNYLQACQQISEYTATCVTTLHSGKKIVIDGIGTLFHDIEKNIQFVPDPETNYLLDSFGLTTVQSPSIKRDNFVKRLEKEPKDREVIPAEVKRKVNVKRLVLMTFAAGILFTSIWIPLRTDLLKGIDYANLNPFGTKEKSSYEDKNFIAPVITPSVLKSESPLEAGADTIRYAKLSFSKKDSTVLTIKMIDTVTPESTAVSSMAAEKAKGLATTFSSAGKYSIIGGCFAIPGNADRYIEKLHADGFHASILPTNSSLAHVSYGSFSSYSEAYAALARIRSSNKDAWMLIK